MSTILDNILQPLHEFFVQPDVSEISINRPGEIWIERKGEMQRQLKPQLTLFYLKDLAKLVATHTEQKISEEFPLLAAYLPQGYRIQIVYPPAVDNATVAISIRKPTALEEDLDWFGKTTEINSSANHSKQLLLELYNAKNYKEFLREAVAQRCNILIAGGTSTGKTTFLNSLLKYIPDSERIITIEDVPEICLTQLNAVSLFATRNQQGRSKIDTQDLVEASLRLRPDRIIVGELRGAEAFSFLRAVNTGHPGSMTTLHADTPLLAFEQLILMVMQKNLGLTRDQIEAYIRSIIDVVVQLKKGLQGERYISEIYYTRFK